MSNNDDKKVGDGIVVYIRKVDKKGMKLIVSKEEKITQMMFYDMVMRNNQFIRFISTQLKDNNNSLINERQAANNIEFYYQGQLINKQDNHTILKLRNLSIIHVIITPKHISNQLIQQNTQQQSQKQRRILKQGAVQNQITEQKAADRLLLRNKNYQQQQKNRIKIKQQQINNSQTVVNAKIMTSKNCSILALNEYRQQQQCNKDINQQIVSIHENKALRLIQKNKNKSVYQSLRDDIKIYQLIRQRLIDRQYELIQLRVKVIHLGRVVEIVIDNNNRQNDSNNQTIPQRDNINMVKINWKQLNIMPNSEIIILISSIKLNQSIQSQTQYNNQQIVNNNHHHAGSLYLLLENTLTLKLYSQYQTNSNTNWNIIYHHHQAQNINHNDSSNNIVVSNIQNINNQVIQTNNNIIDKNITLSYLFDPFIQYYQFISQQQKNNHQLKINQQQPQVNEQLQQINTTNNTLILQSPQQQNYPTHQQLQHQSNISPSILIY